MSDDIFEKLHDKLTRELLKRIETGTATAADLQVARQWLNDNKVAADPTRNAGLKKLSDSISNLPFSDDGVPNKPPRQSH